MHVVSVNPAPALAILPAFELAPIIASGIHADSGKLDTFSIKTVSLYFFMGVI